VAGGTDHRVAAADGDGGELPDAALVALNGDEVTVGEKHQIADLEGGHRGVSHLLEYAFVIQ